jgi:hypothetical protein
MILDQADPVDTQQTLVNEAVDTSKGHFHRIMTMLGFLAVAVGCWGLGRIFQSAYVVSSLVLRRAISIEVISGVRIATILFAYFAFVIGLAICLVSVVLLPVWRARYGSIQTTDADFLEAKGQWKMNMLLTGLMTLISLFIVLLFWFYPVALF